VPVESIPSHAARQATTGSLVLLGEDRPTGSR